MNKNKKYAKKFKERSKAIRVKVVKNKKRKEFLNHAENVFNRRKNKIIVVRVGI
jgi:hypothetical protein